MSMQVKRKAVVLQEEVTVTTSDGAVFENVSEALHHEKIVQLNNRFGETITPEELLENASDIIELIKWSGRGEPWGRKRGPRTRKDDGAALREVNSLTEQSLENEMGAAQ